MEARLEAAGFVRVHRSSIVRIDGTHEIELWRAGSDGTLYFNSDRRGAIGARGHRCRQLTATTSPFASNRPSGQASDLICASRRVRGKFAPAWNLGSLVNTVVDDHPTLRVDQHRLHFVLASAR
jgi:LytTr DNA-binding domain-containing protein